MTHLMTHLVTFWIVLGLMSTLAIILFVFIKGINKIRKNTTYTAWGTLTKSLPSTAEGLKAKERVLTKASKNSVSKQKTRNLGSRRSKPYNHFTQRQQRRSQKFLSAQRLKVA